MKKIFKIIGVVFLIVLCLWFIDKYKFPTITVNFEFVISFLSVIFIISDSKLKYFKYLWMKVLFFVTVVIQSLSTCILFLIHTSFIANLNLFTTMLIIMELALYVIIKLINEHIWNDIEVLQYRIKKRLRHVAKNQNNQFDDINNSFDDLYRWLVKNRNMKNSVDYEKIIHLFLDIVCSSEQVIIKNHYSNIELDSNEDRIIKSLEIAYFIMRKDSKIFYKFLKLFFKIIEVTSNLKNKHILEQYLSIYSEFLSLEIKQDNSKNVLLLMDTYYKYIEKQDKQNDDNLNILVEKLDNLFMTFYIHNYQVTNQQMHAIVADYISVLINCREYIEDVFNIDRLKIIISIINAESYSGKNHTFEISMIKNIYELSTNIDNQLELISRIYKIYIVNNYESERIIYTMCDYLLKLFSDEKISKENKVKIFEQLMQISRSLSSKDIGIISLEKIFEFIFAIGIKEETSKNMIKSLSIRHTKDDALYNYTLFVLKENLCEDNFDDYMIVFETLGKKILGHTSKEVYINMIQLIEKIFDIGSKKYIKDNESLYPYIDNVFDIVDKILDNLDDNDIKDYMISVLDDQLENSLIEEKVYNHFYYIGVKSIESINSNLSQSVSNCLGWYLFNKLEISDPKQYKFDYACRVFVKIKKFYQLICDYIKDVDASGIFVGTIFVINLTHIKISMKKYKNKNQELYNKYNWIYINFKTQLTTLSKTQKDVLKKSFIIRKETLNVYFSDESDAKSICESIYKELFENKKC